MHGDADGRGKSISIELHPAELGSLQIEVRQVADGWEARIIAGRLGTGELLNAHREQLTASMQNLGMESIDLEISHQRDESQSSESGQSQQQRSQQRRYRTPELELTNTPAKQDASTGLNIIA